MKTSNKFILGAFLVFAIALMAYNTALKAEYQKGNYKQPYHNYTSYNIKGFDQIRIDASEMIHVQIIQGDFAVRKNNHSQDSIRFTKVGNKLIVDIDFKSDAADAANQPNYHNYNEIIISCPKLTLLQTQNGYLVNGKMPAVYQSHVNFDDEDNDNAIELRKFNLDSLSIIHWHGKLNLTENRIGYLSGISNALSCLSIGKGNKIGKASLTVNDYSHLDMLGADISQLNCVATDSARVTLTGASLKYLITKK